MLHSAVLGGEMKQRPFIELFEFFLLLALLVANLWDFVLRPEHPLSSLVVVILVVAAFVLRSYRTAKSGSVEA